MIPQSALMLTSGLIFLFFSSPQGENFYITSPFLIGLLIVAFTILPSVLLYILGRVAKFLSNIRFRRFEFLAPSPSIYGLPFGILAIAGFVAQIYFLQTPAIIKKYLGFPGFFNMKMLICIIPLAISIILNKISIFELNRIMYGGKSDIRDFIMPDIKLMLIPSVPFMVSLLISDIIDLSPLHIRIFFIKQYYMYWLIVLAIAFFMFAKSPFFIRYIWKTEMLSDGEIRRRIESLAQINGIKYRDILVWKIKDRNIANAGVAGLLPKSRFIFITNSLLDNLNVDEIEAIVAHELGHIKYKHIPAYMIFSFGYLAFFTFLYAIFYPIISKIKFGTVLTAILGALVTISIFFIYFVFIFRYFSRRFERQADLYSISVIDDPESFKSALLKVARINHFPMKNSRFAEIFRTHPSIYERLRLVDKAVIGDSDALRYADSIVDIRKATLALSIFVFIFVLTKHDFLFPPGEMHYEVGRQYVIEGMLDDAIIEFNKAVSSDPKSSLAIYALGLLYEEKGAVDLAEKQFERVLEINPKDDGARERLKKIQTEKRSSQ